MSEPAVDEPARTHRAHDVRSLVGCVPGEPNLAEALLAERRADREKDERRLVEIGAPHGADGEFA